MMNKIPFMTWVRATVGALVADRAGAHRVPGVVVGGIVMAMFLPIFQLGAVAGGM